MNKSQKEYLAYIKKYRMKKGIKKKTLSSEQFYIFTLLGEKK
jgi:hypothetical protein